MQKYLFMSYNSYGIPMNDYMKNMVRDSLVFDRSRHSLYAQGDEFGYIADVKQEAVISDSYGNIFAGIHLNVKNGVTTLSNYEPLRFSYFDYTLSSGTKSNDNIYEIGTKLSINEFTYTCEGTSKIEELHILDSTNKTYILRGNTSETAIGIPNIIKKEYTIDSKTDTHRKVTLSALARDTRMCYDDTFGVANTSIDIEFKSRMILANINISNKNFDYIKTQVSKNTNIVMKGTSLTKGIYINTLTNNPFEEITHTNQITCTNTSSTYIIFAAPKSMLTNWNHLGVLNNGSAQEFEMIKEFTYTNSLSYSEPYQIYLSTGQNWNGSKFYFNY